MTVVDLLTLEGAGASWPALLLCRAWLALTDTFTPSSSLPATHTQPLILPLSLRVTLPPSVVVDSIGYAAIHNRSKLMRHIEDRVCERTVACPVRALFLGALGTHVRQEDVGLEVHTRVMWRGPRLAEGHADTATRLTRLDGRHGLDAQRPVLRQGTWI